MSGPDLDPEIIFGPPAPPPVSSVGRLSDEELARTIRMARVDPLDPSYVGALVAELRRERYVVAQWERLYPVMLRRETELEARITDLLERMHKAEARTEALEGLVCLLDDPQRIVHTNGAVTRTVNTEKLGAVIRRMEKAEAERDALKQELAEADEAIRVQREEIEALHGGAALTEAYTDRDKAEARADALAKAIEKAPHDSGCWNPTRKRYECCCWKAAFEKEPKP